MLWLAIAIVFDGAAGLAGAVIPDAWLARHRISLIGFATGTLLAAVAFDIAPEAIAVHRAQALAWMAGGFVVIAIPDRLLARRGAVVSPVSLLASDALHNIADGMALAAAFAVSPSVGLATAFAVLAHEVPEEVGDYALLRASGMSRGRALAALVAVQATAALGAIGTVLAEQRTHAVAGVALAIAGGTFLFIAVVDLLPELIRARDRRALVAGAAGFAVIAIQAVTG